MKGQQCSPLCAPTAQSSTRSTLPAPFGQVNETNEGYFLDACVSISIMNSLVTPFFLPSLPNLPAQLLDPPQKLRTLWVKKYIIFL